ncbi:FK506-binding protein 15-like [Sphaeramia orbicularis]|uniref:FK506-binding protein 15-like n=1 Tax=Sphaeramia orbicularis TaxID=375764 RepID=UPI00117FC6BF|nr:FK506-binding protein 15-like [Sphaeramia orbicularis]
MWNCLSNFPSLASCLCRPFFFYYSLSLTGGMGEENGEGPFFQTTTPAKPPAAASEEEEEEELSLKGHPPPAPLFGDDDEDDDLDWLN